MVKRKKKKLVAAGPKGPASLVQVALMGFGLQRELTILNAYFEHFGVEYKVLKSPSLELPPKGDIVVIGALNRYKVGRVYNGDKYGNVEYTKRRVIRLPILGKAVEDDLTKGTTMTKKSAFMAAWVYSGHSLKRDIPMKMLPSKDIIKRLNKLPDDIMLDIDFETTGLDPTRDEVIMVQVCWGLEKPEHNLVTKHSDAIPVLEWLHKCKNPLRCCGATFEARWFIRYCGSVPNIMGDIQVDHCLLDEENYHAETVLAGQVDMWGYDHEMDVYRAENGEGNKKLQHHLVPEPILAHYAGGDTHVQRKIGECFNIKLKKEPASQDEVRSWLVRGQKMLARVMYRGMNVDKELVFKNMSKAKKRKAKLERELQDEAAEHGMKDFNLKSAPQKQKFIYDILDLPVIDISQKTRKPSCGSATMEKLYEQTGNEVCKKIVEISSLNSEVDGLLGRCLHAAQNGDGKMRSNLSLTKLLTGQLSSTEPPMMNVTKGEVRRLFNSRFDGGKIIEWDQSQLHLRIVGNLAQCEGFIDAYLNDIDLHSRTTADVILDDWTEKQVMDALAEGNEMVDEARDKAKRTNFSIIFEIGANALAGKLNCPVEEAKAIIRKFFVRYPEVQEQINRQHAFAEKHGYVISPMGRVRHLPNANSKDRNDKFRALRQSGDYLVSNSGRYINLYSMIMMDEYMVEHKMKSGIIMQVHDSIETDAHPDEVDDVCELAGRFMVDEMMELTADWMDPIPLAIDGFVGPNWYKKDKEMEVEYK